MKPSKIRVGKTYCSKGAGKTSRTVLDILDELPRAFEGRGFGWGTKYSDVIWGGCSRIPEKPVVIFKQGEKKYMLHLSSFARWAGREIQCKEEADSQTKK